MKRVLPAAVAVLLVAAGFGIGFLVADDDATAGVNASELASTLWEGSEALAGTDQPPTCSSQTASGVGAWTCTFVDNEGEPMNVEAIVAEDGSVRAVVAGNTVNACCLTLD